MSEPTEKSQHPEDLEPDKEYEVKISFRMASFILNCTSFLVNNSRGNMEDTVNSFELAMQDLRVMGPIKYNAMMEKVVDILKLDPNWQDNLQVFKGQEIEPAPTKHKQTILIPGSRHIQ